MFFDLEAMGFRNFQTVQPALHTDIILAVWSTTTGDKLGSIRSVDFVRGWYSTWITGPNTLGCGMHADAVLSVFPQVDRDWQYEIVLLHDKCFQVMGETIDGVLPEQYFDNARAFWIEADAPMGTSTAADMLELSRGNCKTKLRHAGHFYPRRGTDA